MQVSLLCSAMAGPTSESRTNGGIGATRERAVDDRHRGALVDDPADLAHEAAEEPVDDERRAVLTRIVVFFSALPVANAVASVASSVCSP